MALFGSVIVPLTVPAVSDYPNAEWLRNNEMKERQNNFRNVAGRRDLRIIAHYLNKLTFSSAATFRNKASERRPQRRITSAPK